MTKVILTGKNLSIQDIIDVAEKGVKVELSPESSYLIEEGRKKLEGQIFNDDTKHIAIYGTNRGCGDLKDNEVAKTKDDFEDYQIRYIKAHNCGTGAPLPEEIVRAIMIIRLNSFAKGMSGMKLDTCQLMLDLLNHQVTPWILEEGSVGASGDLVPLAMLGAVLIGLDEAQAYYKGELMPAKEALQRAGLEPVKLGAKEAMGLTNGSNFIAGVAIFAYRDAERLLKNASISMALSLEAIRGEKRAYGELINEKSDRHDGQIAIARQVRKLIEDSNRTTQKAQEYADFVDDAKKAIVKNSDRVQDRYSFRCTPQIHGASYEALEKMKSVLVKEINSATDNPLFDFNNPVDSFTLEGERTQSLNFASGGNFHGQPLATVIDYLKLSLTSLGLVTDKRTFSLLGVNLSYGLPQDLAVEEGEKNTKGNSGYMIAQYAGAARAAENRILSTPASVMSVSTAANQEDYVSMGSLGALHLRKVIYNCQIIVAIELLCATRGIQLTYENLPTDLRNLGTETTKVYEHLKDALGSYTEDVYIRVEMEKILQMVKSGELVDLVADIW